MDNYYASIPSPIASSTPIHEVDYFPSHLPDKLDWNLDIIEHNYMSLVEEKEKIIRQLKQTISEKDQIIGELHTMMKEMKEQGASVFTDKGKEVKDTVDNPTEEVITQFQLLNCKKNAQHKPTRFVRNLLKLVFTSDILSNSCANGYGSRSGLPGDKLSYVEKSTVAAFPELTHREFNQIVNKCCCDTRKKLSKK